MECCLFRLSSKKPVGEVGGGDAGAEVKVLKIKKKRKQEEPSGGEKPLKKKAKQAKKSEDENMPEL